jgi:hypothetical protein
MKSSYPARRKDCRSLHRPIGVESKEVDNNSTDEEHRNGTLRYLRKIEIEVNQPAHFSPPNVT